MSSKDGFALKRVRLVEASFSSPRNFPGSSNRRFGIDDAGVDVELDVASRLCLVRVAVRVSAQVKDVEAFSLKATLEGLFEGEQQGLPLEQFARVNAPAILFPYLRETVSNMTARSGHPAILLPTVNFVELARIYREGQESPKDATSGSSGIVGGGRRP